MVALLVSSALREKAIAAGAQAWLDALPDLVAQLETEWSLRLGASFTTGTEAFVAEARRSDGTPAVLKVLMPQEDDSVLREIKALRLADGRGCAQVLASDERKGALLLERLGRPLAALGLPESQRRDIMCRTAQRMWRPASGHGFPTGAEKGAWLQRFIVKTWEDAGRPCSARVVDHAWAAAERRIAAHDEARAVLVHGDVHEFNVLEAGEGFKLVDPDGLLAEPEYDLGVILREDPPEQMRVDPRRNARELASLTGCGADAIWEWSAVERVSTGLLLVTMSMQPLGSQMLQAAEVAAQ
ncbi:aminoglycoside phosphotransferase family protein [Chondromyces apiculatus]|nr:aminoglycoside phosphotransferase family protein [Chondromyces apiculatus]